MLEPLIIEPTPMKEAWDCGVACLVMLTSRSYGEIRAAIPRGTRVQEGLGDTALRNIARRVGCDTRWIITKDANLEEIMGILVLVRPMDPSKPKGEMEGHCVMILKGVLYNPADTHIWTDIESFLKTRRWRPTRVLVRVD